MRKHVKWAFLLTLLALQSFPAIASALSPCSDDRSAGEARLRFTGLQPARDLIRVVKSPDSSSGHDDHDSDDGSDFTPLGLSLVSVNIGDDADRPQDFAVRPDGLEVAIICRESDNLLIYDTTKNAVTAVIPVGDSPVDLELTPNGRFALVANHRSGDVTVVDLDARAVLDTINVTGDRVFHVAVSDDGQWAAVTARQEPSTPHVAIIDLQARTEVRRLEGVAGLDAMSDRFFWDTPVNRSWVSPVPFIPGTHRVLVPSNVAGVVLIYDVASGNVVANFPLPNAHAVAIGRDGTTGVAVGIQGGLRRFLLLDLTTLTLLSDVSLSVTMSSPGPLLLLDDNRTIAATSTGRVQLVDGIDGILINSILIGSFLGDCILSHDGSTLIAAGVETHLIDVESRTIVASVDGGSGITRMALSPVAPRIHGIGAVHERAEQIGTFVLDGGASFWEPAHPVADGPEGDAPVASQISPDGDVIVVANWFSDNVSIFNVADRTLRALIPVAGRPIDLTITPDSRFAVVSSQLGNIVRVIDLDQGVVVAEIATAAGPTDILLNDEGTIAFICTVGSLGGDDRVEVIALDGANSHAIASVIVGNVGGLIVNERENFWATMDLSPDGRLLAVPVAFPGELVFIDTGDWSIAGRVSLATGALSASFHPSGTFAYAGTQTALHRVGIDGTNFTALGSVAATMPLHIPVDDSGQHLYIGSFAGPIGVIDLDSFQSAGSIPNTDGSSRGLVKRGRWLFKAERAINWSTSTSRIHRVLADGTDSVVMEKITLSNVPWHLAVSDDARTAVASLVLADAVEIRSFDLEAPLESLTVTRGSLLSGGLPELRFVDSQEARVRSGFGPTFVDLHSMVMHVGLTALDPNPATLDILTRSRINSNSGVAQIRLRNWNANRFDMVGAYQIGRTSVTNTILDVSAANYVHPSGAIELQVKHIVVVPIFAFTFDSFFDQVAVIVR